jgi:predicted Zn-dependent peptidase
MDNLRQRIRLAVLGAGVLLFSLVARPSRPVLAGSGNGSPPQVTLSATVENADPATATAPEDLLIQVTIDNSAGPPLRGVSVQSPIPANTSVIDSWSGAPGQNPGDAQKGQVAWNDLSIGAGSNFGPMAYRIAPEPGADGGTVFTQASIQPSITWISPQEGLASPPVLRLDGLWGEVSLRRTVLQSGLTIFTQERPDTPTVALRLAARAGSRDEDDSTCGGSHWLEHAHFLGTTTRPDNQAVGAAISRVGGEFNAQTSWEATSFWDLVPADKFDVAVDVLSDQMINSTFQPDAFEREKQVIIQEIKLRADTPSTHAFDDTMNLVFRTSPLRRSPAATVCLLTLPISTILAYRAQHYVTGGIAIAASGNLKHDDAVAMIANAFAGLPVGPAFQRTPVPEPVETDLRTNFDGTGSGPTTLRVGWPVSGVRSDDWAPMVILSDILGDTGSRLSESVRDHLVFATGVGADYYDFSDAGVLMLSATTDSDHANTVTALVLAEVQRLRDGDVSQDDVDAAVRATAGERAIDSELNLNQTERAAEEVAGTLQSYDEVLARLQAVTPADVQRVAQTYLDPNAFSLVVLQQ